MGRAELDHSEQQTGELGDGSNEVSLDMTMGIEYKASCTWEHFGAVLSRVKDQIEEIKMMPNLSGNVKIEKKEKIGIGKMWEGRKKAVQSLVICSWGLDIVLEEILVLAFDQ